MPDAPTPDAAAHTVREFLRLAIDLRDPAAARTLMTADSVHMPMFDPAGLAGKQYAIGDPVLHDDSVIVPVTLADAEGLTANIPLVIVMEDGAARIDVGSSIEMMMGGEIHFVGPEDDPRMDTNQHE